MRISLMSLTAKRNPAMTGEKRYLAEPAIDISPLALEYCSLVRRSVIVAVYEGPKSAENTELIVVPR